MKTKEAQVSQIDELCLEVGKFIEFWGFKEIEGRIWSHLFLSNHPLCSHDLIERTGVTKGLISISLNRLMEYNVIRIEYIEGKRTQYYQVNENIFDVIRGVLKVRELNMLSSIEKSSILLKNTLEKKNEDVSLSRLNYLIYFVKTSRYYLRLLVKGGDKLSLFFKEKAPLVRTTKPFLK